MRAVSRADHGGSVSATASSSSRLTFPREAGRFRYPRRSMRRYRYAHAADFLRLDVLIAEGGVYADIDTLFVSRLPRAALRAAVRDRP